MGSLIQSKKRIMMMQHKNSSVLPAVYQRVEYVENPDTAFLVTNFYSGDVDRVDCDFHYVTARTWCNLLGTSDFESDPRGSAILLSNRSNTKLSVYPNNNAIIAPLLSAGNRYSLSAKFTSGQQELSINGSVVGTSNFTWSTSIPYMSLFGIYYGSLTNKVKERGLVRIYSCQFYGANGEIIEDFIPCYRKSDNEIGMYGSKTGTFYTNSGTGSFLKGNDI